MSDGQSNGNNEGQQQQVADERTAPAPELLPDGSAPDGDSDLILSTFFGSGSGSDKNASSSGASSDGAAPPAEGVSAATGTEGGGSPGASVSGQQSQPSVTESPSQAGSAAEGTSPTAAPAQPSAPAQPQPEANSELELMRAQVQALMQQNQILQRQMQAPQQGQQTGSAQQTGPESAQPEPYALAIPDDVLAAIEDENPQTRKAGLAHLINASLTIAEQRILTKVPGLIEQQTAALQQAQQQQQQLTQQQEQYFAKFPQHKDPTLQAIVSAEASQMWAEMPHLPWNDTSIAALGSRVNQKLSALGFQVGLGVQPPQQQQMTEQPPVANAQQKPAAMMGQGTRPAGASAENPNNFILDTLK